MPPELQHQDDIQNERNLSEEGNPAHIINAINRLRLSAGTEPTDRDEKYEMFDRLADVFYRASFKQTHALLVESYIDRVSVSLLDALDENEILSACILLADKWMQDPADAIVKNCDMARVLGLSTETLNIAELAVLKDLDFRLEPLEFDRVKS